jgi:adenylate cyclase
MTLEKSDKKSPQGLFGNRRFKVDIVMVFCALVVPTVIIISSFTYFKTVEATRTITNSLVEKVSNAVIEKTANYLKPAQILAEIAPSIIKSSKQKLAIGSELDKVFVDIINRQPQVDLFYYGTEQGDFIQAYRNNKDQSVTSKLIDRSLTPPVFSYRYRDPQGNIVDEASNTTESYDPRVRPWYKGVKETRDTYWTDLYIFHETSKPGITAAAPVVGLDDALQGVVASDITLDGLSHFLKGLNISDNGIVFILNSNRQFVAYPDPERMVKEERGKIRPILAVELNERWITDGIRHFEDSGETSFIYESGDEHYIAKFTPFPASFGKDWTIVVMLPESDFLGVIDEASATIAIISTIILLIAVMFGFYFARNLSRPIEALTEEVKQIHSFNFSDTPQVKSHIKEIQTMSDAFVGMKNGLMAFRRFVPADLVRRLIESGEDVKPGGKEREVTLFFSDIEGFTSIAEQVPARELMVDLSEYFEEMTLPIAKERGTVDKYIGDAVMAFWGAPGEDEDQAIHACRAALNCQRRLKALNERRLAEGKTVFNTRIGLHTGFSIVGNMGSSERLNYTALGDNVNLASRLEGVNKRYGTNIIVSQGTYRYVRNEFVLRPLDYIAVVGKENSVQIFELMGDRDSVDYEALKERAEQFKIAYELYLERQWAEALDILTRLHDGNPDDQPVAIFIARCEDLLANDPGPGWVGHVRLNRGDYVYKASS